MKSPFPGMDPYLERTWGDVHSRLVLYSCDQLQEQLPSDLLAQVEERVAVEAHIGELYLSRIPDVRVTEEQEAGAVTPNAMPSEVAVAEPLLVPLVGDPATETFL